MDTFVESSWYFDRFACPDYDKGPLDKKRVDYWMPVDQYIEGLNMRSFTFSIRDFSLGVLKGMGGRCG